MTDFKKGGPLQNSNIFATNRLFVKNPLFKKKKKKRAPGVYNPKGKFKYEDGGTIQDLSEEEIQKYIDGGYVVEEINDPSIPKLDRLKPGGAPCPRGQMRDASGKCVPYNWGSGNIQAADSYTGMYGGYDASGTKNLTEVKASAKKGKKFSDYILRGGKSRADVARNLGKNAGAYFGMPGEALEPVNFTKAGLDKFTKDVKNAEKGYKAEEKNRQDFEKALKKKESGKMSTDKFAQQYNEKGWANYDPATMKEGYEGQFQDAVDEANVRKEANMGVTNTALEFLGGGAGYRILSDPLGTAKGVVQTVGDVATLPVGLGEGIYNYANTGNFDMGVNPLTGANYGEGLGETFDVLGVIPGIGAAGKLAKFTKAGDLVGDAGKLLTTKTPLKNTYKLLGKNSEFFNPGEVPHWRKGYQEVWNPEVADLAPLKKFDEILKDGQNIPKQFKKQKDLLTKQRNAKTEAYRKNLTEAQAKGDSKRIEELQTAHREQQENFIMEDAKINADIDAYKIKKYSPFEEELGSGSFGKVFSIPGSNKVVKIGRQAPDEIPEELIKRAEGVDKSNIALPKRVEKLYGTGRHQTDATVMNKVDSRVGGTDFKQPDRATYQQLLDDMEDLESRGLYADFQNPDNIVFNPQTGKYNIYDLNTTGHYMSRKITPEMGYTFKPLNKEFAGVYVPDPTGHSMKKILKDHRLLPEDFKKGGATNDYIELDIPEEEIQWYIDNGYRVEPVSKLKKFIG